MVLKEISGHQDIHEKLLGYLYPSSYTTILSLFLVYHYVLFFLICRYQWLISSRISLISKEIGYFLVIPRFWRIFVVLPQGAGSVKILEFYLPICESLPGDLYLYVFLLTFISIGRQWRYVVPARPYIGEHAIWFYLAKKHLKPVILLLSLRLYFFIRDFGSYDVECLVIYQWRRYLWPALKIISYPLNTSDVFR